MAKKRFNREEAIGQSLKLFWQHGYNGASMQQVFECTGLKPGSIYLAFGNKEGLFQESVAHYAKQCLSDMDDTLKNSSSVEVGLCQILEKMIAQTQKSNFCCCFLIKCQLELTDKKQNLQEFVSAQLRKMEDLYTYHLTKEYAHVNDGAALAKKRATDLMLHLYGLQIYGYHHNCEQELRESLKAGLPWLPWQQEQQHSIATA